MSKLYSFHQKYKNIINVALILLFVLFFALPIGTRSYVSRDGIYTERDDVARYIMEYHELPVNYVTLRGYQTATNGEQSIKDLRIGGDTFWNRGTPTASKIDSGTKFRECDINNADYVIDLANRGTSRLVYTVNEAQTKIFYTEDHYNTFVELNSFYLQQTSNILWIVWAVYDVLVIVYFVLVTVGKNKLLTTNDEAKNNENPKE